MIWCMLGGIALGLVLGCLIGVKAYSVEQYLILFEE